MVRLTERQEMTLRGIVEAEQQSNVIDEESAPCSAPSW
jgi:hypothetical protein